MAKTAAPSLESKIVKFLRTKERANKLYRANGALFDSIVAEMQKKGVSEAQISPEETYELVDHFAKSHSVFKTIRADRFELKPKRYA
jgi:hypothetical protein